MLGKTRLSEYGFSPSAEFEDDVPVRNPWNTGHTSGASSAGSAAFVAAGAVPFSHANDGGGSIRIPAACNGLVGLKATRGRIPGDKLNREMPVQIVHDGVVTRSVRDTAAFVRESERAYRNLKLPPVGDVTRAGKARLRIALVTNSIGDRHTDDETTQTVEKTAALLDELGHTIEPVEAPVPDSFEDDFLLYWSALALALSAGGKRTFNRTYDRSKNDNLTKGLARHAAKNAWRLPLAITRLRRSHRISKSFFAEHDVVLTPTLSLTTPELGWLDPSQSYETVMGRILEWVSFTPLQNATGDPAISLPMGMSSKGLPIGVQLAAAQGYDRRLHRDRLRARGSAAVRADPGLTVRPGRHPNWLPPATDRMTSSTSRAGVTSSAWADRATSPRSSYTSDAATPTAPPPSVVRALRQTHSPSGGRTTCTVSSVFMKFHSVGSRAAEAPEAESTQVSSRCRGAHLLAGDERHQRPHPDHGRARAG